MPKILIVEDDKYLVTAYRMKMTKAGFEFRIANDGEEALAVLAEWRPDIILLDLVMPRKDGYETLADVKAQEDLQSIPVLVTSNLGQQEELDRAVALGATGFIIKSNATLDQIIEQINKVVGGEQL